MNKVMWITAYLFLLIMFYVSATVCFMSEMQWLAILYVVSFGALLVALGDRIIKD